MSSALPAAVLWDMDGTLVDTEPYWMEAETALVESFGGTWTHEQADPRRSGTRDLRRDPAGGRRADVRRRHHRPPHGEVTRLLASGAPASRRHELLAALRGAGVRCALVTMSMRRMAEQVVAPFPELFEIIVAGDDVTRPKPFPDAYLQACGPSASTPPTPSRSRTRRRACAPPSPRASRRSACR
jgi:beta-phosphoglucomutase-like phosphatase (HAD superfamily)